MEREFMIKCRFDTIAPENSCEFKFKKVVDLEVKRPYPFSMEFHLINNAIKMRYLDACNFKYEVVDITEDV
jgi:hypothetical protein